MWSLTSEMYVVFNVCSGVEATLCLSQPLSITCLSTTPSLTHSPLPFHNHLYPLHLPSFTTANPCCNHHSINTPAFSRPACLFCLTTDQTWVLRTALVDRLFCYSLLQVFSSSSTPTSSFLLDLLLRFSLLFLLSLFL